MKATHWMVASALVFPALPASADVVPSETGGFASGQSALVPAGRAETWAMLVSPEKWWSHTWSGDSGNLSLEPVAGGCFCEILPPAGDGDAGSVEHMRVIMVQPGTVLRMSGALGPLQGEALAGTLTVSLEDAGEGTRIRWRYVVGGQASASLEQLAPVVDDVQAEFLGALAGALGGELENAG